MKISEDNYVELMKKGNEKALWYFIEHHGWIVKSIVHKKMAAFPEEQEECMNDIFLAIWENAGKYDERRAAFTTWAAAVAKYRTFHYMCTHCKEKHYENIDDIEIIGHEDVNAEAYRFDEEREFRELLGCLSKEDQEIFMKLFWEEMSHEEISSSTGMSKEVLYNRISRGKKKIRKNLKEERHEGYLRFTK